MIKSLHLLANLWRRDILVTMIDDHEILIGPPAVMNEAVVSDGYCPDNLNSAQLATLSITLMSSPDSLKDPEKVEALERIGERLNDLDPVLGNLFRQIRDLRRFQFGLDDEGGAFYYVLVSPRKDLVRLAESSTDRLDAATDLFDAITEVHREMLGSPDCLERKIIALEMNQKIEKIDYDEYSKFLQKLKLVFPEALELHYFIDGISRADIEESYTRSHCLFVLDDHRKKLDELPTDHPHRAYYQKLLDRAHSAYDSIQAKLPEEPPEDDETVSGVPADSQAEVIEADHILWGVPRERLQLKGDPSTYFYPDYLKQFFVGCPGINLDLKPTEQDLMEAREMGF